MTTAATNIPSEPPAGWATIEDSGFKPSRVFNWRKADRLVEGPDFAHVRDKPGRVRVYYNPAALSRELKASEDKRLLGIFHGLRDKIKPSPPPGAITIDTAIEKHGIGWPTMRKMIAAGQLPAGFARRAGSSGRRPILVSGLVLGRLEALGRLPVYGRVPAADRRLPAPPDGMGLKALANKVGVQFQLLDKWLSWDPHPALGRRIARGVGVREVHCHGGMIQRRRQLLFSLADAQACADAYKNPLNRPLPGNPGEWIADGSFSTTTGSSTSPTATSRITRSSSSSRPWPCLETTTGGDWKR
jgi:hypothetical protein